MLCLDKKFIDLLYCPLDKTSLNYNSSYLTCCQGHKYPVVNGIPVVFPPDLVPTLWVAEKSWELANQALLKNDVEDQIFIETLGLSNQERKEIKDKIIGEPKLKKLEVIIKYMLQATSGLMYKGLAIDINNLPIPEFPLSNGKGLLLDIGCNWGRWSLSASRQGFNVIGLDPSIGALIVAKEICEYNGIRANFVCADARYLPFKSDQFDAIFSYSVFQHFSKENTIICLDEIKRVLKEKGVSYIQMANILGIRSLLHQIKRGFKEPADFEVRYWYPWDLKKIFNSRIGTSSYLVDCFFGLGVQDSNMKFFTPGKKLIALCSKFLKSTTGFIPFLRDFADSMFVKSVKEKI